MDEQHLSNMTEHKEKLFNDMVEAFSSEESGRYSYILDLATGEMRWPFSAVKFFGLSSGKLDGYGREWQDKIYPEDRGAYRRRIEASVKDSIHIRYRVMDASGSYVTCDENGNVIYNSDGKPAFIAGTINNYGVQSGTDTMTGLPNLYAFFNDMKRERENSESDISDVVMLIGVSHFDNINNEYGYTFGNRLLLALVEILHNLFKDYHIYRMDGVKFAICGKACDKEKMINLYELARSNVRQGVAVNEDGRINLNMCGGIMTLKGIGKIDSHTIYSCLLYAYTNSKDNNQGDLVKFRFTPNEDDKKWLKELNVIRESVVNGCNGFEVYYQPVISVKTGKITGAEALMRWSHPDYGIVSPGEFLPVLEKDSVFVELGNFIMRQALRETKKFLKTDPKFFVDINLSSAQIERSNFTDSIINIIKEEGYPLTNVCLELTESCCVLAEDILTSKVAELKAQGVRFALDDFGTGLSSLSLMKKVPVDEIKIDRQFVKDIINDSVDQSIINGLTHMVISSGKSICIEGVESEEIQQFLRRYPVSYLQGYFYSKPVPIKEFEKIKLDHLFDHSTFRDISETERLEMTERTNTIIIRCAKILQSGGNLNDNIGKMMGLLAEATSADLMTLAFKKENEYVIVKKWMNPGLAKTFENFNTMPKETVNWAHKNADADGLAYAVDFIAISELLEGTDKSNHDLATQDILFQSLRQGEEEVGFFGIRNYRIDDFVDVKTIIKTVAFFLAAEIRNKNLVDQLKKLARVDQLVGCRNRNAYEEDIALYEEKHKPFGMVFADLNGLKVTNDTLGHDKGDELIRGAARVLTETFKEGILYRIGGDEFIVAFENFDDAEIFNETMAARVENIKQQDINISIGWGFDVDSGKSEEIRLNAEKLMYMAKAEYYRNHDRRKG